MTDKSKNKTSTINFGTILLIAGAAVNIPRWMGVFIPDNSDIGLWMHKSMLPVLDAVAGALMGIVAAGAVMYVFHALGNTQRVTERTRKNKDGVEKTTVRHNERWYITAILGVSILVISVYILQPYAESVIPGFVRSNVGDTTLWSYLAVLASEMIIAAIALADKSAAGFASSALSKPEQTGTDNKQTTSSGEQPSKSASSKLEQAMSGWLSAHSAEYQCQEQDCKFNAVLEAQSNGRSSKWQSIDQAQESLRKMLSGHQVKHKKQAPIPVEPTSVFGK